MNADPMPAEVPLSVLVPQTTVGIAILWRNDDGTLGAAWRDAVDRVPMTRTQTAQILRQLADALDAQAEEVGS